MKKHINFVMLFALSLFALTASGEFSDYVVIKVLGISAIQLIYAVDTALCELLDRLVVHANPVQ